MANNYLGKNFGTFSDTENAEGIVTKYLNLQGLTDFWGKIKTYVDDQDTALYNATKTKIGNVDSTLRSYIESLTINGTQISTNKTADALGTSLTVEIGGEDIKVNHNGTEAAEGEKYADGTTTVRKAFADVDTRLDNVEKAIGENIVNKIEVTDTPNTKGTPNYVSFTSTTTGDPKNGDYTVKLDVDESELDTKIANIDGKITELEANAGVAGIRVVDTDSTESTNLVEVSLNAVKVNDNSEMSITVDGVEYYKSLVTLTVDETKLGEYITKNEANLSALGGLTVNGHQVITVTPAAEGATPPQVTVAHTDVVLCTADITRNTTAGAAGTKNLEEQLTDYDTKFAALASATHFRGKYDTLDAAVAAVKEQGDIVIVGLKEYVYYDAAQGDDFDANYTPSNTNFIELGDVEEEQTRIENLEDWVDNNIIQEDEITAIFTANGSKPTFTF